MSVNRKFVHHDGSYEYLVLDRDRSLVFVLVPRSGPLSGTYRLARFRPDHTAVAASTVIRSLWDGGVEAASEHDVSAYIGPTYRWSPR